MEVKFSELHSSQVEYIDLTFEDPYKPKYY
ncbi:hypothetical protein [Tenacibaculum platacis]